MASLIFPTAAELHEIEQDLLPRLTKDRLGLQILPMVEVDAHIVMWEQKDNYAGLQQLRGLGGDPKRVRKTSGNRYMYEPGVYGEFDPIDEIELTMRRNWGTFDQFIKIDDLVRESQDKLLQRRLDRIESINWTLATTGEFTVPTEAEGNTPGGVAYSGSYPIQSYSAAYPWSDPVNSTPLADLAAMQILHRGHSVDFGPSSMFAVNLTQMNYVLANRNENDIWGLRGQYGATVLNNIQGANTVFQTRGLPPFVLYDQGYIDEATGDFTLFIPTGAGVLIGRRTSGVAVGKYQLTRNSNNPGLGPGAYTDVIDRGAAGSGQRIPRIIEVHDGHNGGPDMEFPSALIKASI